MFQPVLLQCQSSGSSGIAFRSHHGRAITSPRQMRNNLARYHAHFSTTSRATARRPSRCRAVQRIEAKQNLHAELTEWASQGPLVAACGFTASQIDANQSRWAQLGAFLCDSLGFPDSWQTLDTAQRARVYHFYLPVFFHVEHQLDLLREQQAAQGGPQRPLVFGISAPQGSGKSTLVVSLVKLLQHTGRAAVDVSIDDFYLTRQDQRQLAESNPDNPLLQVRGNAGTHDLQLGRFTLEALTAALEDSSEVAIPRYDKSQHQGKGDRAPREAWPRVRGKLDVVLFEGWMLGFRPHDQDETAAEVEPNLAAVNSLLKDYVAAWDAMADAWLVLRVADPQFVYRWRAEAEIKMREAGKPAMTDEQIVDFVDRYMPAYKAYLPSLYAKGPSTARPGHLLVVELDENRSPVPQQPAAIM